MEAGHSCTPALTQAVGLPSALSTLKCQGFRALLHPPGPMAPVTACLAEWPVGTCLQGVRAPVLPQPGGRGSHKFTLPVACGINVSSTARFTSAPLARKAEKTSLCVHTARRAGAGGCWGQAGHDGPAGHAHAGGVRTQSRSWGGGAQTYRKVRLCISYHNRSLM